MSDSKETIDVSVVIPAYLAGKTISRALASVACQTVKPKEVIVIDDGSTDGTADAARVMSKKMGAIAFFVIEQENLGAGAARNRGLDEASGVWIAFLDADDEWLENKIECSMAVLVEMGGDLVAHDFVRIEPDGAEHRVECARRFEAATTPLSGLYRQGFIGTSTVIARRQALLDVGGFDETLLTAQDFDLWLKIFKDPTAKFTVFAEPLARYYVSDTGITSVTTRRMHSTLKVAVRHAASLNDLIYRLLAIHYEAFSAHVGRQHYIAALWTCIAALVNIPATLLQATVSPSLLAFLSWVWVVGVFLFYTDQFRSYLRPIMNMLGLT